MKNSTAPNRKTGRMIAKNLIVLFTVALAGFCGIQAWFTDKRSAEANGIEVECQAPDGIEIAVVKHEDPAPKDDAAYKNTIELNSKNYSFVDDIKMTEVSSDGYTFYKPPLKQENGVASPILDVADWDLADSSVHFLSFDLYVRSKSKFDIIWTVNLKSVRMQKILQVKMQIIRVISVKAANQREFQEIA